MCILSNVLQGATPQVVNRSLTLCLWETQLSKVLPKEQKNLLRFRFFLCFIQWNCSLCLWLMWPFRLLVTPQNYRRTFSDYWKHKKPLFVFLVLHILCISCDSLLLTVIVLCMTDNGVIIVQAAMYGRTDAEICSDGIPADQLANTQCFQIDTLKDVKSR